MYGFQPKSARGKAVQQLADGGMVHSIKGMLGLRPKTREELLAADAKAQARNQEAAGRVAERSAQQPAPATPAPQAAISDYSGMNAIQRREKEQGLKNGGMVKPRGFKAGGLIRGPGTGTSDSIETEKRPGTFIMPADSTKALGKSALEKLATVPVKLSNGEFEFPPEQVMAVGAAVLKLLKDTTHKPVNGEDGGQTDDEAGEGSGHEMAEAMPGGQEDDAEEGMGYRPADSMALMPPMMFADGGMVAPRRMDIGQWAQGMEQWRGEQAIADARQAKAFQDQADADEYARQQAEASKLRDQQQAGGAQPQLGFADGGMIENDVTRVGNSYSGGNVGGNITVNGQEPGGSVSSASPVPSSPVPATPSATPSATPAANPTATPSAATAPVTATTTPAPSAAPMGWAERNAQRSNEVTASSIMDSPERRAAQAKLTPTPAPVAPVAPTAPAIGGIQPPATAMDAAKPKAFGAQAASPFGFKPRGYAGGGVVKDEERARLLAQIPTGSNMPAPPSDGSGSTELSRNVNNGLNALGGLGVVASVPLRVGQTAKAVASGAPALPAPVRAAAAPAADFVAGMGSKATTYANSIPRLGNAPTPTLPAVNAALQEGAQANALSAATRTVAGAGATATNASNAQPADVPATATTQSAQPSEYGRQMGAVGSALADGAAWLGKTIVSAPGYGFNRPDAPAPTQRTASTAGAGRGSVNPPAVVPANVTTTAPVTAEETAQTAAAPTQAAAEPAAAPQTTNPNQVAAGFVPGGAPAAIPQVVAPTVRNSTNDWAARKALENMATAASSITNRPEWQSGSTTIAGSTRGPNGAGDPEGKVAAYKVALANDLALQQAQPNMEQAAMRENGANQRATLQDQGATARTVIQDQGATTREASRTALAQGEQELRRTAAGFQTRAAAQQEKLRNTLIDPKATPEQRKQAQEYLQALAVSDKEPSPQYKSYVMPAIRNADGSTTEGGVYQENTRTGEGRWVKPQGDGQAQQGALPKVATPQDLAALKSGTRFVDSNGVERIKK